MTGVVNLSTNKYEVKMRKEMRKEVNVGEG